MTPIKLAKTLIFLQLHPRRLVRQGLAPKELLVRMAAAEAKNKKKADKSDNDDSRKEEDLSESVAVGMDLMSVEDENKQRDDGFMSIESGPAAAPAAAAAAEVVDAGNAAAAAADAAAKKKNVLHEAFIAGGIRLRPREVRPLLLALDVNPRRLEKLGHVDGKNLRAMLEAEKKAAHKRGDRLGPRQPRMARGCGARVGVGVGGGGGGPGGKPCGRVMMMARRNLHPIAHPPPPPSASVVEEDGGMLFVPAKRGGGHGDGRRGPPHGRAHGPPPQKRHGRYAGEPEKGEKGMGARGGPPHGPPRGHSRRGGPEENKEGAGFPRGVPQGMMRMRRAPGGRQHQPRDGYCFLG